MLKTASPYIFDHKKNIHAYYLFPSILEDTWSSSSGGSGRTKVGLNVILRLDDKKTYTFYEEM